MAGTPFRLNSRQSRRLLTWLVQLAAALPVLVHAPPTAHAANEREIAVSRARAGRIAEAIAELRTMWARGSPDPLVPMDLAVLLQQDGQSASATAVFERANVRSPPSYALLAMVRAYRDQKQFDRAENLALEGLHRFPNETVWLTLLALVMTDAGKGDAALNLLARPTGDRANSLDRLLAQGYAANQAGRPFEALRYYADVARRDPSNAEARNATVAILARSGPVGSCTPVGEAASVIVAERHGSRDSPLGRVGHAI